MINEISKISELSTAIVFFMIKRHHSWVAKKLSHHCAFDKNYFSELKTKRFNYLVIGITIEMGKTTS